MNANNIWVIVAYCSSRGTLYDDFGKHCYVGTLCNSLGKHQLVWL